VYSSCNAVEEAADDVIVKHGWGILLTLRVFQGALAIVGHKIAHAEKSLFCRIKTNTKVGTNGSVFTFESTKHG
jgi:hypothetical protein